MQDHPMWCRTDPAETEHRSAAVVVDGESGDEATVRAWLTCLHASPAGVPVVTVEYETMEVRASRALTIDLVRELVDVLVELGRWRTSGHRPAASGHPGWCGQQEMRGGPHRSAEREAAVWHNDDRIRMWLAQSSEQPDPMPMTHIEMCTDDHRLEWPPLTPQQHDALPGRLVYLLDRLHLADR